MPSLFRIDRNSLTADGAKPTSVALPNFQDLVKLKQSAVQKKQEEEPALEVPKEDPIIAQRAAEIQKQEQALEAKKQELAEVQRQIDELRSQATGIIEDAQKSADSIKKEATEKGYEEGYKEAQTQAAAEAEEAQRKTEDAIMGLKSATDTVYDQVSDSVLDLALFIAEQIIHIELDRNDEAFLGLVRETLTKVKNQNHIVLRVSKDEYERLFADPHSDVVTELKNSGIEIRQDLSLQSGDCIAETQFGTINAGIKTQLKKLSGVLTGGES